MSKGERMEGYVRELVGDRCPSDFHPCYAGYFVCFNRGQYYEAHDVLEHLWLTERDSDFFKGLIQLAGAFVHMKKHFENPGHPKFSGRLGPAGRLLDLALVNLNRPPPDPSGLSVPELLALASDYRERLSRGGLRVNPWSPRALPQIRFGVWD